ncbi:GTP pyrophosphokinase family protein [Clostridia bacterium OttesenSCG-928-F22]|nr:GTP pyrophosphokinase family protein [Clostridia bacterium OttesenSCG-928-F22]
MNTVSIKKKPYTSGNELLSLIKGSNHSIQTTGEYTMKADSNKIAYFLDGVDHEKFPKEAAGIVHSMLEMQNIFQAGMREIQTKLEILSDEFQTFYQRNPIHQIHCRLKTPKSIVNKLIRRGYDLNLNTAMEQLNDIAGIRVICPYINDIYTIANLLKAQDDISLIKEVDYIKNPKPNGYRSLHIIVSVPVYLSTKTENVKVELQIRTIAMDFWATLEHELNYKMRQSVPDVVEQLTECAESISEIDTKMQGIYNVVMEKKSQEKQREDIQLY